VKVAIHAILNVLFIIEVLIVIEYNKENKRKKAKGQCFNFSYAFKI
jgi:hypothetical protein